MDIVASSWNLSDLDAEQRAAVTADEGPTMVIAGPGAGKTRVLTYRAAWLLEQGVAPYQILAVTFTNKAAGEMRQRISELVGHEAANNMWISTFHSTCARLLRYHSLEAGLPNGFNIADADDSKKLIKKAIQAVGVESTANLVREVQSRISFAKNKLQTFNDMAQDKHGGSAAAEVWVKYEELLKESSRIDFDDLLIKTRNLLANNELVRAKYAGRFKYVLADEFQDTNAPQYDILRYLASKSYGGHDNPFVVGDPRQLIYGWRGATQGVLGAFQADWPKTRAIILHRNYRSTPQIVAASQAMLAGSSDGRWGRLTTQNAAGRKVRLRVCADTNSEADFVVNEIAARVRLGENPSSFAILYRTNAQSQPFEEAFRRSGLPYRLVGSLRFYDRAEIRDSIAWLQILVNPSDLLALERAITAPKLGLGPAKLEAARLGAVQEETSVIDWVRQSLANGSLKAGKAAWATFITNYDEILGAVKSSPAAAVGAILAMPGFATTQLARGGEEPETRLDNVKQLASAAAQFMDDLPPGVDLSSFAMLLGAGKSFLAPLAGFLSHVSLVSDNDDDHPGSGGGVTCMTAHAAKGKEFDAVYTVGWEAGLVPHARSVTSEALNEERRIAFVVTSRARHELTITAAHRRRVGAEWQDRYVSPYVANLPGDVQTYDEGRKETNSPYKSWSNNKYPSKYPNYKKKW